MFYSKHKEYYLDYESGLAGIYNWMFSTSFVIFLPLFKIDIYDRINSKKFPK